MAIHTSTSPYDGNKFMMSTFNLPIARFVQTLEIVEKEGRHLIYSWSRLYNQTIDVDWVNNLDNHADCAEQMSLCVSVWPYARYDGG
jgi:hypothetical protein